MAFLVTRPGRAFTFPAAAMPRIGGVPVDIEETTDAYQVDLDLPDVDAADVRIDLRDNEIRVAGNYRARVRAGTMHHHARQEGEFEYLIALPGDIDDDRVEANLDSGVLTIIAPKARGEQTRRITVQATQGQLGQQAAQGQPGEKGQLGSKGQPGGQAQQGKPGQPGQSGGRGEQQQSQGRPQPEVRPDDTPAAQAKQMREGQSRPGPASQQAGGTGTGSTGQVGRSGMS
ncbi:Hsp20/alpha crystallin family protein [Dactylosporangium sp. NPDC049525]|uniref:Hsp20/alpha crystallin family protein n=1 Tax=Dactylosporangium sp. NPDC049525 TaxID=3154730 RepID=UPI00342E1814